LVVKPAGAGASHFKVALGWPCKREDIWGLRREARYPDKGCGYRAWWRRKWQWQVDLEDAERLRLWELANSEELRLQVERYRAGSGEGSDSEVSATVVAAFCEPEFYGRGRVCFPMALVNRFELYVLGAMRYDTGHDTGHWSWKMRPLDLE
jgi:hypothetical protein